LRALLRSQGEKAMDMATHCSQVRQAWDDTQAGRTSPVKPW